MTDVTLRIEDSDGNHYIADVKHVTVEIDSADRVEQSRDYIFEVGEMFEQ